MAVALGFVTYLWFNTRLELEALKNRVNSSTSTEDHGFATQQEDQFLPNPLRTPFSTIPTRQEQLEQEFLDEARRANDIEEQRLRDEKFRRLMTR